MRKFTIFLAFMLFCGLQVTIAQTRITGNVTSADDGLGIPGVSVIVKDNITNLRKSSSTTIKTFTKRSFVLGGSSWFIISNHRFGLHFK